MHQPVVMRARRPALAAMALVGFLAFLALPRDARAESTTCGPGRLVETGQSIEQVFLYCGKPSIRNAYVVHGRRPMVTVIEEWTYDLGEGTFLHWLRFVNGRLEVIEERSRWP